MLLSLQLQLPQDNARKERTGLTQDSDLGCTDMSSNLPAALAQSWAVLTLLQVLKANLMGLKATVQDMLGDVSSLLQHTSAPRPAEPAANTLRQQQQQQQQQAKRKQQQAAQHRAAILHRTRSAPSSAVTTLS